MKSSHVILGLGAAGLGLYLWRRRAAKSAAASVESKPAPVSDPLGTVKAAGELAGDAWTQAQGYVAKVLPSLGQPTMPADGLSSSSLPVPSYA